MYDLIGLQKCPSVAGITPNSILWWWPAIKGNYKNPVVWLSGLRKHYCY